MITIQRPQRRSDAPAYWVSQTAELALEAIEAKNYVRLGEVIRQASQAQHVAEWTVTRAVRREWLRWGVIGDEIVAAMGGEVDLG